MKNNEWNVPSDYFEKNKKALMPVRKMRSRTWLLALAAACFVGAGLFMWKGDGRTQEIAEGKRREEEVREGKNGEDVGAKNLSTKEDIGSKYLSTKASEGKNEKQNENENENEGTRGEEEVREGENGEDVGAKNLSTKEDIAEGLKEIPREELVAYLLEEDSELIENLN